MKHRIMAWLLAMALSLQAVPAASAYADGCGTRILTDKVNVAEYIENTAEDSGEPACGETEMSRVIVELAEKSLLECGVSVNDLDSPEAERMQEELFQRQDEVLKQVKEITGSDTLEIGFRYTVTFCGFSAEVPADMVDEIRTLESVSAVRTVSHYYRPDAATVVQTMGSAVSSAGNMIGSDAAYAAGYDGTGVVIAVIDTGLDIDHPAFADDLDAEKVGLTRETVCDALEHLNAWSMVEGLRGEDVFCSNKIPFGFNYADGNTDVTHDNDSAGDHGTHVAGIAAAGDIPGSSVWGVASGAQLLAMKVFGQSDDTAAEDALVAAVEDAIILGADVINLSLGTSAGFSQDGSSMEKAIQRAVDSGVIVCAAAGNDRSSAYGTASGTNRSSTGNVDVGVISAPASYGGVLSVASVDNAGTCAGTFSVLDGEGNQRLITYSDSGMLFGRKAFTTLLDQPEYENGDCEYVCVPGVGAIADYANIEVAGKIALVQRGEIAFSEKCEYAFQAGACAVVVWNNDDGSLTMDLSGVSDDNTCPCVLISREDGETLVALTGESGTGRLTVLAGDAETNAGRPSEFSSWGVLPDLTLKPELSCVGGEIYSTTSDGSYGVMSGTSMAAPQAAGAAAVLLQYLRAEQGLTGQAAAELARTLLMNTAVPAKDESGTAYSPRKQGAGLIDLGQALTTEVYLTVEGKELPKAELGDDPEKAGIYSFEAVLHNMSDETQVFAVSAQMITEQADNGFMMQTSRKLDADVSFTGQAGQCRLLFDLDENGILDEADAELLADAAVVQENPKWYDLNGDGNADGQDAELLRKEVSGEETSISGISRALVTVPAGGTTRLQVQIVLGEEEKLALDTTFENGIYMEGYLTFAGASEEKGELSLPILAFYGDWSQAPLFEDVSRAEAETTQNGTEASGNSQIPFTVLTGEESWLGMNPTAEDDLYIPERSNALNLTGGEGGVISDLYLDLLRSARNISVEIVRSNGRVIYSSSRAYVPKSHYSDVYGICVPVVWTQMDEDFFFDPASFGLKDGDMFTLRITGEKSASGASAIDRIELPVYVDGTGPDVLDVQILRGDSLSGAAEAVVTVRDNFYVSGIMLMTADGETVIETYPVDQRERGEEVSVTIDLSDKISRFGGELVIAAADYARNITTYDVNLLQEGETSVLPEETLLAFASEGSERGWYTLNQSGKAESVGFWNYLGPVAAAEAVGDTIFAVLDQATDELYAIDAATFQPEYTFSLGLAEYTDQVMDMTYNASDGNLYLLLSRETGKEILQVDPREETAKTVLRLQDQRMEGVDACALACGPDGTLYLIGGEADRNTGEMTAALYAAEISGGSLTRVCGLGLKLENSTLSAEVDPDSGILYFTYFCVTYGETASEDQQQSGLYYWRDDSKDDCPVKIRNLNGMAYRALTLTDGLGTVYAPDDPVTGLVLSCEKEYLLPGKTLRLSVVNCRPWYVETEGYRFDFSSSDPSVAAVDKDGVITARRAGTAEITVAASKQGEKTVSAVCRVIVEKSSDIYGFGSEKWAVFSGSHPGTATIMSPQLTQDAEVCAYGAGAGPDGQDVIFVLGRSRELGEEMGGHYTLYTYDSETLELLMSLCLTNAWDSLGQHLPQNGFSDMTYDPYWDMLIAVSGRSCFALDPDTCTVRRIYRVENCPEDRSITGVAADRDGTCWLLDSAGTLYQLDGYFVFDAVCHAVGTLSVSGSNSGSSGLEYDQLRNVLWIRWGRNLYTVDPQSESLTISFRGVLPWNLHCFFLRRYN